MCSGCRARAVGAADVLCANCWPLVPPATQKAVRQAQKAFYADPTDDHWAELMLARAFALGSLPWDTVGRDHD